MTHASPAPTDPSGSAPFRSPRGTRVASGPPPGVASAPHHGPVGAWVGRPGVEDARYTQGSLALRYPLPSGVDSSPAVRALTVVRPTSDDTDPSAEAWAARFLQAVLEVMTGDRPLTQLIRWTDESVYAELARRLAVIGERRAGVPARGGRHHVATVHVCQLSSERAEVAARVTNGRRSRAVAARLERHRGRWVCTAITFG